MCIVYSARILHNRSHFCWGFREVLAGQRSFLLGLYPKVKNEWNKWKNHFHEMKGDVGMTGHEKGREQEDAYTKTESHS